MFRNRRSFGISLNKLSDANFFFIFFREFK